MTIQNDQEEIKTDLTLIFSYYWTTCEYADQNISTIIDRLYKRHNRIHDGVRFSDPTCNYDEYGSTKVVLLSKKIKFSKTSEALDYAKETMDTFNTYDYSAFSAGTWSVGHRFKISKYQDDNQTQNIKLYVTIFGRNFD